MNMKQIVICIFIVAFVFLSESHAGLFDKVGNEWNRAREKHLDPIGDKVYGPSSAERENIKRRREEEATERAGQDEIKRHQEEKAASEKRKLAEERAAKAAEEAREAEKRAASAEAEALEAESAASKIKLEAAQKEAEMKKAHAKLASQIQRLEEAKKYFDPNDPRLREIDAMLNKLESDISQERSDSEPANITNQ